MNRSVRQAFLALVLSGLLVPLRPQAENLAAPLDSFSLEDPNGGTVRYTRASGKVAVVIFTSTRCPISNAFNFRINALYKEFADRVTFFVVNSNANESQDEVHRHALEMGYEFPVFKDRDNVVADLFGARSTPDSFVIDRSGVVKYHGYIEDRVNAERTTNRALGTAIELVLQNQPVPISATHSLGCAIRRVRAN